MAIRPQAASRMLAVYAGGELVYQLTGANLSSPQTAEMNAAARAATIGKWVLMTHGKSVVWITLLCVLDGSLWPAVGGGLAMVDMHFSYRYAIRSGLASGAPGTENYSPGRAA
jgi:hypothetical protein